jgi:hypothetical protein
VPIRWLIPIHDKTALGLVPGAVALWRLGGLHGNRPGVQGSFKLRRRVYVPVSLRSCPERHESMVGVTHR